MAKITIVLSITMYNEIKFIDMQLENALEMDCYDHICILDDGSDDGTWDKINEYASKYSHIHVFKNDQNSIVSKNENRWFTACKNVAKFEPTWVNNRAADIIYCDTAKKFYRTQMEKFTDEEVGLVLIPNVHLWRSNCWYRADNIWGAHARGHSTPSIWRFNKNNKWSPEQQRARLHQGFTRPTNLGFGKKMKHKILNEGLAETHPWPIVGLHHGHIDQEAKVKKFIWSMEVAKAGSSIGMPNPANMPPVSHWIAFNGYKGFVEWDMDLRPVEKIWYDVYPEITSPPKPRSLYEVIKNYNPKRAEEYKNIFERRVK